MQTTRISRRHLLLNLASAPAFLAIATPLVAMKQQNIGQDNWRWCHKCEALWFAGHATHGAYPADGAEHSRKGSGNYVLA